MLYDFSREALYHPESKPVFVDADRMPRFKADDFGFSPVNAWWLSNASHAAYYEANRLEDELHKVGLQLVEFFTTENTQAFLAACNTFSILAFRGTEINKLADLKANADIRFASFQDEAKVHRGFLAALDKVWQAVDEGLQEIAEQGLLTWYTGHSLGAALATLAAARGKPDALFAFGSPQVGNKEFVRLLDDVPVQRIVNCCDAVPTFPMHFLGYRHVGELHFITSAGELLLHPPPSRVLWSKAIAIRKYLATLPWFRRGIVKARSFADHAIVNYTAALAEAVAHVQEVP
jgi:triacylglycerol lipase